jgi:hypothetical protein
MTRPRLAIGDTRAKPCHKAGERNLDPLDRQLSALGACLAAIASVGWPPRSGLPGPEG